MLVKVMLGSSNFTIFEQVSNLVAPVKNEFLDIPREWLDNTLKDNSDDISELITKSLEKLRYLSFNKDPNIRVMADKNQIPSDEYKYYRRFKVVSFDYLGETLIFCTQFPIYICNDSAKTIETI